MAKRFPKTRKCDWCHKIVSWDELSELANGLIVCSHCYLHPEPEMERND